MRGNHSKRLALVQPSGYTLLEMLLVLAVLLAITGIVWPPLNRIYADHHLKTFVEDVRVKLTSTRVHALDTGITYQFRFEPEGQHFVVIPYETDLLGGESSEGEDQSNGAFFQFAGKVPDDLHFSYEPDADGTNERLPEEFLDGLPNSRDLEDASWSAPILFYPDGSAIDAAFRLIDSKSQTVTFSVRGLTGAVTTSDVVMEEKR